MFKSKLLKKASLLVLSGLLLIGNGIGIVSAEEDVRVVNISTTVADTSTITQAAVKFGELVGEKTNGRYEIRVYPNEQLAGGNSSKSVELLSNGAVEMTFNSNIIYSVLDDRFSVLSLPFLFETYDEVFEKLEGPAGQAIYDIMLEKNIVGLGIFASGFRQLTNNGSPVRTPEDLSAMRIRVPGMNMYIELYQHLGADPLSMNFSEVFTSLQQGTIDGQENPLDLIDTSKIYEVQNYVSLWNYSFDAMLLGANKDFWDDLPEEDKILFQEAADEANEFQRGLLLSGEKGILEKFEDHNIEVIHTEEIDMEAFRQSVEELYPGYEERYGKELIDLFRN